MYVISGTLFNVRSSSLLLTRIRCSDENTMTLPHLHRRYCFSSVKLYPFFSCTCCICNTLYIFFSFPGFLILLSFMYSSCKNIMRFLSIYTYGSHSIILKQKMINIGPLTRLELLVLYILG